MNLMRDCRGCFDGCDFVLQLEEAREIRLLQLTDMQFIDSTQRRTPERLSMREVEEWLPEKFDLQCADQIRALVERVKPDLIFITGDLIYGSFDDKGTTLHRFCELMDSFAIPWAPVFGNHDNESFRGVAWQCRRLEESEYCLFRRGRVSGNGNYSVGVAVGDRLLRVLHMTDSNGCKHSVDPEVIREKGIYPDQIARIEEISERIARVQGEPIPAFMAFHFPTSEFERAEIEKGYSRETEFYAIGRDVCAKDGDFGSKKQKLAPIETDESFLHFLKECRVEAVFVGHHHLINTCIVYQGIRWVFGTKTGCYDFHDPEMLGGTLIRLQGKCFEVEHVRV
ncbi:MAG: metallophosphoesterase [Clostridia bacterium]|nr:metallophosphoesterase [Clostridia bacterium]